MSSFPNNDWSNEFAYRPAADVPVPTGNSLADMFSEKTALGATRLFNLIKDHSVAQITLNDHETISFIDRNGPQVIVERLFPDEESYLDWINTLMGLTDAGLKDIRNANSPVVEASFTDGETYGSIHICTREITRGEPVVTIRKQPRTFLALDEMLQQGMMSNAMRLDLEMFSRGRLNILISGGSGAGKSTLARALAQFIDPYNRVLTVEDIDELHLNDIVRGNVVALTTFTKRDDEGRVVRETDLNELVRQALRMRADRIWVGETRGKEAYALVKAALSGHAGCVTTIHANSGAEAVSQLVSYVQEAGVPEEVARDMVARAFNLVVQIEKIRPDRRVISEIVELEPVREKTNQRTNPLYTYDIRQDSFIRRFSPTDRLIGELGRHGVNYNDVHRLG